MEVNPFLKIDVRTVYGLSGFTEPIDYIVNSVSRCLEPTSMGLHTLVMLTVLGV